MTTRPYGTWSSPITAEMLASAGVGLAETLLDDGVVFTNVRMPLVRTPMITPTKLYSRMPALSMEQAATVVCDATITRCAPSASVSARTPRAIR